LARAALLPMLVHVAVAADDLETAAEAADELDGIVETFDTPTLRASRLSTRGRLDLATHAPDAVDHLRQAADAWRALEVPYEEATARTLLGQARREQGDEAGATEAFAAASALFEHIGAHLDARLVYDDTPARTWPAGLTKREVEVLRLIAAGLTNNEIATELFLSAKTVSRHLSNIFTKIGVSSRAGATAYAFEHRLVDRRG
jgi:DNA-binding CsgD family transcriptional regulator